MKHWIVLLVLVAVAADLHAQAYRYPNVPDSIQGQQKRATYLTEHFWDNADLNDPTLFAKPKVILDYLFLLYLQPEKDRQVYIENTVNLFSPYPEQIQWLIFLFDRYLHNKESRYYNDTLYQQAIDAILQTDIEEGQADILIRAREVVKMNNVGEKAEDFIFMLKDETEESMYSIASPMLLLIFNNPDCPRCQKTERLISDNEDLQRLIVTQKLSILSITIEGDYENWKLHQYPVNWICGYDYRKTIENDLLYEINKYPSIYLLDNEKRVLLKEAEYEEICKYLGL